MDDLKLFTKDDDDLEGEPQTVKRFSDDIGMSGVKIIFQILFEIVHNIVRYAYDFPVSHKIYSSNETAKTLK